MVRAGVIAVIVAVLPWIALRAVPASDGVLAAVEPISTLLAGTLVDVPGIRFGA